MGRGGARERRGEEAGRERNFKMTMEGDDSKDGWKWARREEGRKGIGRPGRRGET